MKIDNLEDIIKSPVELEYFKGLLSKCDNNSQSLIIHTDATQSKVYPTAIAPAEILKHLPYRSYESIKSEYSSEEKSPATLWLKKMHGGLGSSIERNEYLREFSRSSIGAKGTDLFIKTKSGHVSIAEAQIIQATKKLNSFENIIYQDILNEDVVNDFEYIWKQHTSISRFSALIQTKLPTLDAQGELTTKRVAPAGHGLFGYEVLTSIFDKDLRPGGKNIICSIGNGEDLSSTPDRAVTEWMLDQKIPICMVTTTKTNNDLKGGQIALQDKGDEGVFLTIIEKAQAESANQLDLFSEIGLREGDGEAFFNTNLVLLNIDVLEELFQKIDKEELLAASLPDLIQNKKEQDGQVYTQLEGAMGSVFLNLDTYWRKKFNRPLVHIMNVSSANRTRFFSPIKSAFDYFMQYHSDRFSFNEETFHLINNNRESLPMVSLPSVYKDISNVLRDFSNAKIQNLKSLELTRPQDFSNKTLSGDVTD